MRILIAIILCVALGSGVAAEDKKSEPKSKLDSGTFTGLALRGIGPAIASGRISDIAVHPDNYAIRYATAASGGVWMTTNWGTTWTPIFDSQGSYSIGCITMDPNDPLVLWVGTGENNMQRSVSYGDGVYKSVDSGKTWENVGLKNSEHIGNIVVDPRNSKTVYVAAQGPLWSPGGDRGVYKTTDAGKTWTHSLKISENTGATEVLMDPRNSEVLYASTHQHRRHVWTQINGGPESAIYKSTDAGATWKKLETGLPKEEMGRMGLAISPVNPDVVYAVIEAANKAGGFFRSTDAGGSWEKRGDYASSGQYYNEIFADPKDVDRIYAMDTWMMVSEDGGKTFQKVGEKYKHVDNHALWINPNDTNHLLSGCDGGIYETWDRGATWFFNANLPITQFYRLTVDNSKPFYFVYGGTQDNNTLGGPSRTNSSSGITNYDWFVTVGGDGFWAAVDPEDPNIVYSEYQYGGIMRFDRKTGETTDIQPQPAKGEPALRWNWDSPLIISPHSRTRLYFAAQRLFRSDDRGDSWTPVSPDLTRQLDRNKLKVMGRVWSVDSVAKNTSTSFYGNIVSFAESPVQENLLYVGTDDGLIQVTEDGGANWRKIDRFPGVPEMTYVSDITPSEKEADTVFAAFDNHKMGDFKPYLLKSTDRGKSWSSIAGNLPDRGTVYTVAQDGENSNLLFAGTEFGLFFTIDGGKPWVQLKGGLPVIAVKDVAIQKREADLVLATFGRGFYILDDYAPLRSVTESMLEQEAARLFSVKKSWMFIPTQPLSLKEKGFMGDAFYMAPNPPFGAIFTYYLKDELKTKKKIRQDKEKELIKEGKDVFYPTWEELRAEDREEEPSILITVTDEEGNAVRRLTGPVTAGFHRVAWDLRYPPADPTSLTPPDTSNPWANQPTGWLAAPGTYRVSMAKRVNGVVTPLGEPQTFSTAPLLAASLPAPDYEAMQDFQRKTSKLQRAVLAANDAAKDAENRLKHLKKAIEDTPGADQKMREEADALIQRVKDTLKALNGDPVVRKHQEPDPPSITERVQQVVYGHWVTTGAPTGTWKQNYDLAAADFVSVLDQLRKLVETDLKNLEDRAEAAGAPHTPGRVPRWTND